MHEGLLRPRYARPSRRCHTEFQWSAFCSGPCVRVRRWARRCRRAKFWSSMTPPPTTAGRLAISLGARVLALGRNQGLLSRRERRRTRRAAEWVAIVKQPTSRLAPDGSSWLARRRARRRHAELQPAVPITRHDDPGASRRRIRLCFPARPCPWAGRLRFPVAALRVPEGPWLPSLTALLIRRQTFIDAGPAGRNVRLPIWRMWTLRSGSSGSQSQEVFCAGCPAHAHAVARTVRRGGALCKGRSFHSRHAAPGIGAVCAKI